MNDKNIDAEKMRDWADIEDETIAQWTNENGETEEEFVEKYDGSKYEKPSVTVDMALFTVIDKKVENYRKLPEKELRVLLIKRANHPYIGHWALPGGFANMDEGLDEAVARELKEETNINNIYSEQLYTWGAVNRDSRTRVISASYLSLVDSQSLQIEAGSDAKDVQWFAVKHEVIDSKKYEDKNGYTVEKMIKLMLENHVEKLSAIVKITKSAKYGIKSVKREVISSKGIAFDHAKIIQYSLERLRNKVEYTDIVFNLMSRYFTLTELQRVYETILSKKLLNANFRRKIMPMVIETDEVQQERGHRPSKFYKFNPFWEK